MNLRLGTVLLCTCLLYSCQKPSESNIEKSAWIVGTWANQTSKGVTYETWTKVSAQEIVAKSYALSGKDTTLFETIRLIQEEEGFIYIPMVSNQNEGLPIRFTAKMITDTSWLFENLNHDFPQWIGYRQVDEDSLVATISGKQNGQKRSVGFSMRRVN